MLLISAVLLLFLLSFFSEFTAQLQLASPIRHISAQRQHSALPVLGLCPMLYPDAGLHFEVIEQDLFAILSMLSITEPKSSLRLY